jgi:hypothetical protein
MAKVVRNSPWNHHLVSDPVRSTIGWSFITRNRNDSLGFRCVVPDTPLKPTTSTTAPDRARLAAVEGGSLLPSVTDTEAMLYQQFEAGRGSWNVDRDAARINMDASDGVNWHVRLLFGTTTLQNDHEYRFSFLAKADTDRVIDVKAVVNTPTWPDAGLVMQPQLTTQWKKFEAVFQASNIPAGSTTTFQALTGQKTGIVWMKDVSLVEDAAASLVPISSDVPSTGIATSKTNLLSPYVVWQQSLGYWHLWQGGEGEATWSTENDALKVVTTRVTRNKGEKDYFAQFVGHAVLKENTPYTVRFRARADTVRQLPVEGEKDGGAKNGLHQIVRLTTEWQPFDLSFTTRTGTSGHNLIPEFLPGSIPGTIWIADVSVEEDKNGQTATATQTATAASTRTSSPTSHVAATENYFGRPLEPQGRYVLNGLIQDSETGRAAYTNYQATHESVVVPMFVGVFNDQYDFLDDVRSLLAKHLGQVVIPQIGLFLNPSPQAIADGKYDEHLKQLCQGLKELHCPAFIRIG